MLLERGKKKTGKGKVVPNAQNSVLRGLGKVMGILSFFWVKEKKNINQGKYQLVKENASRKWKMEKEW